MEQTQPQIIEPIPEQLWSYNFVQDMELHKQFKIQKEKKISGDFSNTEIGGMACALMDSINQFKTKNICRNV